MALEGGVPCYTTLQLTLYAAVSTLMGAMGGHMFRYLTPPPPSGLGLPFHHMCVYSQCSDINGEFKNDGNTLKTFCQPPPPRPHPTSLPTLAAWTHRWRGKIFLNEHFVTPTYIPQNDHATLDPNKVVVARGPGGGEGGSSGRPGCVCWGWGGGQGTPTYVPQNDRHVVLPHDGCLLSVA